MAAMNNKNEILNLISIILTVDGLPEFLVPAFLFQGDGACSVA
ncbi:MAG: hypothetical protein ACI8RU_000423 [Zhongshania aliphaticivorans]